jgi:flagellar hook-basal body complex protein FliE
VTGSILTVTPLSAANAYQRTAATGSGSFGETLGKALDGAVALGEEADASATTAISNGGDVTHVVTAISKAQLALQEIVTVRDKVVQAYQEVMRMSI